MPKLYHQNQQWVVPGQQDRAATRHDIPAVPAELARWLNEREVCADAPAGDGPAPVSSDGAPAAEHDPPTTTGEATQLPQLGPAQIEAWLMDTATGAEVERLFTALGVRFHEMRKSAQL